MRLTDLDPHWVGAGGEGVFDRLPDGTLVPAPKRTGVGITFNCPCGQCGSRGYVGFSNPLDGGPAHDPRPGSQWQRTGETFETLTLTPSIQRRKVGEHGCTWHGFITNGEIVHA